MTWEGSLRLRQVWNRSATQPLCEHSFSSNSAASLNSILPAVLASEPRTVRELCNLYSLDCGFSVGTIGGISTSRRPRRICPFAPRGVASRLAGTALRRGGRIMAYDPGVASRKTWIASRGAEIAKNQQPSSRSLVCWERFLDAEDGKPAASSGLNSGICFKSAHGGVGTPLMRTASPPLRDIAAQLNARGIQTARGCGWTPTAGMRVLKTSSATSSL
jgi:hypothetical protein